MSFLFCGDCLGAQVGGDGVERVDVLLQSFWPALLPLPKIPWVVERREVYFSHKSEPLVAQGGGWIHGYMSKTLLNTFCLLFNEQDSS